MTLPPAPDLLLLHAWGDLREQLELCQGMFRLDFRGRFFHQKEWFKDLTFPGSPGKVKSRGSTIHAKKL